MILALLLLAIDPSTYVGNVYGTVTDAAGRPVADALVTVGDRYARTGRRGEFLINSIPTPYDGRDYPITVDGSAIATVHILPGAAMALELTVRLGGKTEWHYRHELRGAPPPSAAKYTRSIFATREGLVGGTTANGHVIVPNDRFAALPSRRALSTNFGNERQVGVTYLGRTVIVPVWDIGPWNIRDDYWNPSIIRETFKDLPRGKPEAQAAFFEGYNGGLDERGRVVRTPAGIDLADGTFLIDLGLTNNDYVDVEYLWLDSVGPQTSALTISPNPATTAITINIDATVADESPIAGAEFFVDTIGSDGTGSAAAAVDGAFDSSVETVRGTYVTNDWIAGAGHTIYFHARDAYDNWGPVTSASIFVAQLPKRRAVRR
ncbi:MAG TPA: carboxypeptidase-like regulatory domain-containing protein [Thermoanaerobaculia bacterium]|nr:carboxypeptidase-like regulatory domain-containing protein [Thermoanaerobaculia bacterium]